MFDKAPKGLEKLQYTPEKGKASKRNAIKRDNKNRAWRAKKAKFKNKLN